MQRLLKLRLWLSRSEFERAHVVFCSTREGVGKAEAFFSGLLVPPVPPLAAGSSRSASAGWKNCATIVHLAKKVLDRLSLCIGVLTECLSTPATRSLCATNDLPLSARFGSGMNGLTACRALPEP